MTECGCIYVDIDGTPDFYHTEIRKARKPHKCGECKKIISPGQEYEYVVGKWDGCFDKHKTCMVCKEVRGAFFCLRWTFGDVWQDFREHLSEMHGSISEDCILDLTPKARDLVFEAIEEYWKTR